MQACGGGGEGLGSYSALSTAWPMQAPPSSVPGGGPSSSWPPCGRRGGDCSPSAACRGPAPKPASDHGRSSQGGKAWAAREVPAGQGPAGVFPPVPPSCCPESVLRLQAGHPGPQACKAPRVPQVRAPGPGRGHSGPSVPGARRKAGHRPGGGLGPSPGQAERPGLRAGALTPSPQQPLREPVEPHPDWEGGQECEAGGLFGGARSRAWSFACLRRGSCRSTRPEPRHSRWALDASRGPEVSEVRVNVLGSQ